MDPWRAELKHKGRKGKYSLLLYLTLAILTTLQCHFLFHLYGRDTIKKIWNMSGNNPKNEIQTLSLVLALFILEADLCVMLCADGELWQEHLPSSGVVHAGGGGGR